MVRAWYMDDLDTDQRAAHITDPPQFLSLEDVREKTGVEYFKIDVEDYSNDEILQKLRKERGYNYEDEIEIHPSKLPDYEKKLKIFFEEHLHSDEEIRLILAGSGYFDARDRGDRWVRIEVLKGDMIILPAGIYHRFTLDLKNYIKAKRYFLGEPVWTPHNRGVESDKHPARASYIEVFGQA